MSSPIIFPAAIQSSTCLAAKNDMPTPLATDGDWSAYLDEETTGYGEFWGMKRYKCVLPSRTCQLLMGVESFSLDSILRIALV